MGDIPWTDKFNMFETKAKRKLLMRPQRERRIWRSGGGRDRGTVINLRKKLQGVLGWGFCEAIFGSCRMNN